MLVKVEVKEKKPLSEENEPLFDIDPEDEESPSAKYTFEMGKNLQLKSKEQQDDPRIEYRMKRIAEINQLLKSTQDKIELLHMKKGDYLKTREQGEQKTISNEMNLISKQVNQNLQIIREKMKVMNNKIQDMSKEREEQIKNDTDIRMMKTVLNCFQAKSIELLKSFSKFQMQQKALAKQFAIESLMLTQNEYSKEELEDFNYQQLQELQMEQREKFQGKDEAAMKVNDTLEDIRTKVMEIKKIEKQVNDLVQMIQELQMIIRAQTEVVNSIYDNVEQIDNYIEQTKENVEESNKLMTSANDKLWCFFVVLVFIMIFVMNKILSTFF